MTDIRWVVAIHNVVVDSLIKHINITGVHDIISSYTNGYVHIGRLDTPIFTHQEFWYNYITCQIKYIRGFTFIDFWRVERYDEGGAGYSTGWNISHNTYIYKNMKLYRDKINFFLLYSFK